MQAFLFLAVSVLASVAGTICGIGGGIIIKPTLDFFQLGTAATLGFLSGCTVLSMSCYSVVGSLRSGRSAIDLKVTTWLGIGAAIGGVLGQQLFAILRSSLPHPDRIGPIQAACLVVLTAGTLAYTLYKRRIKTLAVRAIPAKVIIGFALGLMSSFLGIGGGPMNLVMLHYFFSMQALAGAQNSLYIILISQAASLLTLLVTRSIPPFEPLALLLMVLGGIGGGMIGRRINRRLQDAQVDRLFIALMVLIIGINLRNMLR